MNKKTCNKKTVIWLHTKAQSFIILKKKDLIIYGGFIMEHIFQVINKSKLDSPKRREILPVEDILKRTDIKKDDCVADVGCGIGYFTFPIEKLVGENGKVYAIDLQKEMLQEIEDKIREHAIPNIYPVLSEAFDLKLESAACSIVFLSTVLHEIGEKKKFLIEAKRILNISGKIILIDWQKTRKDYGPPEEHRVSSEEAAEILKEIGFEEVKIDNFNEYFYIIQATKNEV